MTVRHRALWKDTEHRTGPTRLFTSLSVFVFIVNPQDNLMLRHQQLLFEAGEICTFSLTREWYFNPLHCGCTPACTPSHLCIPNYSHHLSFLSSFFHWKARPSLSQPSYLISPHPYTLTFWWNSLRTDSSQPCTSPILLLNHCSLTMSSSKQHWFTLLDLLNCDAPDLSLLWNTNTYDYSTRALTILLHKMTYRALAFVSSEWERGLWHSALRSISLSTTPPSGNPIEEVERE